MKMGDRVIYKGEEWEIGFVNNSVTGFSGTLHLQQGPTAYDRQVNYVYPEQVKLIAPPPASKAGGRKEIEWQGEKTN